MRDFVQLGLESEDGGGSSAGGGYERPAAAPKLAIKGVRSVNIMETLSQLAGGGDRRLLKSTLPATPMAAPSPSRGGRTRGRTPDWIKKIFDHAKRGQLDQLVSFSYEKHLSGYYQGKALFLGFKVIDLIHLLGVTLASPYTRANSVGTLSFSGLYLIFHGTLSQLIYLFKKMKPLDYKYKVLRTLQLSV